MPTTFEQLGTLSINGDITGTGDVTNSAISFVGGQQPVSAQFTCIVGYSNSNPYFDRFVQKESAFTLKFELKNDAGLEDQKLRTIEFQQAKITDYLEVYNMNSQTIGGVNDLSVSFTIAATSVSMGEAKFPSGS